MSHMGAQPQDLFHLAEVTAAELAAIATAAADRQSRGPSPTRRRWPTTGANQ